MAAEFTLDDFAAQLRLLKQTPARTDPMGELLDYFRASRAETLAQVEKILAATEPAERQNPSKVGPAEWQRIASTSGVELSSVKSFFSGFDRLLARMRTLAGMGFFERLRFTFRDGLWILLPWLLVVVLVVMLLTRG
jgi:signal recognition particle GTPase